MTEKKKIAKEWLWKGEGYAILHGSKYAFWLSKKMQKI